VLPGAVAVADGAVGVGEGLEAGVVAGVVDGDGLAGVGEAAGVVAVTVGVALPWAGPTRLGVVTG
jgi:hypothetical protein